MMTLQSTGLNGIAAVEQLQQALTALAQAVNWPAVNPGAVDGIVGAKTRGAVLIAIQSVPQIPGRVKDLFLLIGITGALSAKAAAEIDQLITQYASELTTAIKAYIAAKAGSINPSVPGKGPVKAGGYGPIVNAGTVKPGAAGSSFWNPPVGTPWYKQGRVYAVGAGITAVGVGAFFLFRR